MASGVYRENDMPRAIELPIRMCALHCLLRNDTFAQQTNSSIHQELILGTC